MKNILLIFLCLLSINLIGQVERQPNLTAKYFASQSGGGSGFWQLTGTFTDDAGVYDASGVQVGDIVFFSDGTYTFFLPVTEVVSATHPTLVVKVSNVGITQISSVPSGMKAIFHPTSKGYFPFVSGISNADQQVYNEYLMSLLDSASGGTNRTKPDTTIFAMNNATADLSGKTDTLGGRGTVTLVVTKSTGVLASPTLPAITDTILGTKFKIKLYCETPTEQIGMFQNDLGFVESFDGTNYIDESLILIRDLEEYTFWPVEDSNGFHWAYSKSGADRLNTIYTASDSITNGDRYLKLASDGSQTFGLGNWPGFPDRNYDYENEYGLYVSPAYDEEVTLSNKFANITLYPNNIFISTSNSVNGIGILSMGVGRTNITQRNLTATSSSNLGIDSAGVYFNTQGSPEYKVLPSQDVSSPSTTTGVTNILKWTGNGSSAVPSFGPLSDAITTTARTIHYSNSSGRLTGNTYFRADTTTSAGALARMRLNLNKTFDISVPDSYTVFDVFSGDAANAGANFFIGDQTTGYITAGYDARMMLYRYGGSLNAATNISNGNTLGRYGFGGYVAGTRNNNLSGIFSTYRGDGTTTLAGLDGRYSNGVIGWRLDETGKFWLGTGGAGYYLPPISAPSVTNLSKQLIVWTGDGTLATPTFSSITALIVDGQYTTGTPSLSSFGTGTYQRYTAVVELTSGASANTDIALPTANSGSFGKSILLSPRDLNTSYNINVTGSIEYGGASTSSIQLTKPTEFVCNIVGVGPTTYRWVMVDNAANTDGSSTASTDGSGDVQVTHNKNHTNYKVFIQSTGTTLGIGYTVTAKTATTFTVRFYDTSTKAAITSTSVPFDWFIKE